MTCWGVLGLVAGAAILWASGPQSPLVPALSLPWWILVPAAFVTERFLLRVRAGGRVIELSLSGLPLAVAFLLAQPWQVVVGFALGQLAAMVAHRDRPAVLLPNVGSSALALAIGVTVTHALANHWSGHVVVTWAATSLGLLAATAVSVAGPALVDGRRRRSAGGLWPALLTMTGLTVISSTVAFLGVELLVVDRGFMWLIGGLAVLLAGGYRSYLRLLSQTESLERLYQSTKEVDRARAETRSVENLLDQTLELLGADLAEITFLANDDHRAMVLMTSRGGSFREIAPETAARMAEERVTELEGEIPDVEEYDAEVAIQLSRQIITAPLMGSQGIMGTLRVSMNPGDAFTDADRRLFEMFANHASVALQNSNLIDRLRAEVAEREHQALHDPLTALPNRVMFDLQVRQALDRLVDGRMVAVMLADLDRFKEVNDTLGHDHGDELLEILAERLDTLTVEDRFTVARLGGDEFAMLLRTEGDDRDIEMVTQRVKAVLEAPCEIAGIQVDVGASVGVSVAPRNGVDATTLLQRADVAMYLAKRDRRGIAFYDEALDPYSPERLSMAADLRQAVFLGEVEPWFQPVVSLTSDQPVGVEALARWTHPQFGPIPPDMFIPIAEQSGLIRDLTYLMLERSLTHVHRWQRAGHQLRVAVNLSVRCLQDEQLVTRVEQCLRRVGLEPSLLTLEVTEGTLMADPDRAIEVLEELNALGVSLSIDDFGMGYSSLNQLKRMPVNQLKIDRSFVMSLTRDPRDRVIVESMVGLGHSLGMQVVAEGVEEPETLEQLRAMGCDSIQGFLVAAAMPGDQFQAWLDRRQVVPRVVSRSRA